MIKIKIVKKRKNLRTEKKKKFKNFISVIFKINTNFSGHLEKKNECCPELSSCVRIYPIRMLYISFFFINKKNMRFSLIIFYLKQNKIVFYIDKR